MFKLKGCEKCGGDLYDDSGPYHGEEWVCLQCAKVYVRVHQPPEGPARRGAQLALFGSSASTVVAAGAVADSNRVYHRRRT